MTDRRDRGEPRRQLLVPLVGRHLAAERIEDPAVVGEQLLHAALGRAAAFAVVHPELPFRRRHQHLGVRIGELVIGIEQPVHVIGMEVGDDHHVDVLELNPGRREIVGELPKLPFGLVERARPVTRVDHDELRAGVHDDRRIVMDHPVGRQIGRLERLLHLRDRSIGDVGFGQRERARAVGRNRHLVGSDLVAIDAGRLLAGRRRGSLGGRDLCQRGRPDRGGPGEH